MGPAALTMNWRAEPTPAALRQGGARPAISVVVPTYRCANRLAAFLDRLSTVERASLLEVLIVDQTPGADHEGLRRFSSSFAALRFLKMDTANVAMARNTGAIEARADILLFVDDDMELEAAFAVNLIDRIASVSRTALGARWTNAGEPRRSLNTGAGAAPLEPADFLPSGALAIARDDFFAVGGFDQRLHRYFEDAEFSHRLKRGGIRLVRDARLRAIHHDEKTDGTWHSPSLREAASTLARQQAYFNRKIGRSWPQTVWTLARTVASEARHPAYLRKGNIASRAILLTLSLPSALVYAAKNPALCTSVAGQGRAARQVVAR